MDCFRVLLLNRLNMERLSMIVILILNENPLPLKEEEFSVWLVEVHNCIIWLSRTSIRILSNGGWDGVENLVIIVKVWMREHPSDSS